MAKPRARKRRAKGKVRISQRTRLRKRSEQSADTIKKMDAQMPRTVAPVFKVKIKKKQ